MSSATSMFKVGSEVLGYYGLMASWRVRVDGRWEPSMCIASCASSDEGVFEPAQSVTINSRAGLLSLRKAIDDALNAADEAAGGAA